MEKTDKKTNTEFEHMTLKMVIGLAAPHTWVASIFPCLIGVCCGAVYSNELSVTLVISLLLISILMQSAVNTFNDYYDYVKGVDTKEDTLEESDAVLIYNNINPKNALMLAIIFLVVAFIFGIYVTIKSGWVPLIIGIVGCLFVVLYSAGKSPISYLPLGEIISGIVMGGLIMIASYYATCEKFTFACISWSIPSIITVGLEMMTNNTCDIEKDIEANRKTLPALLGRKKSLIVYHTLMVVCFAMIVVNLAIWFNKGIILVAFMLLGAWPFTLNLWKNPQVQENRIQAMGQICTLSAFLGAMYSLCIIACTTFSLVI